MVHRRIPEQDGADKTENGAISGNAQRQCQSRNGGEAWIFAEHPSPKSQVGEEGLEEWEAAPFAVVFLSLRHSAELDERLPPRCLRAHTVAQIIFHVHLQMCVELLDEFIVGRTPSEHSAES